MASIWVVYRIWLLFAPPSPAAHKPFAFGWLYWASYAAAGVLLVVLVVYLRFCRIINMAVSHARAKLRSTISPEDKEAFKS